MLRTTLETALVAVIALLAVLWSMDRKQLVGQLEREQRSRSIAEFQFNNAVLGRIAVSQQLASNKAALADARRAASLFVRPETGIYGPITGNYGPNQ